MFKLGRVNCLHLHTVRLQWVESAAPRFRCSLLKENVVNNRRAARMSVGLACFGIGVGQLLLAVIANYVGVEISPWYYAAAPLATSLIAFMAAAVATRD